MRKILSISVLCFFLTAQTSHAFAPVAIPMWYYGAGALAVGGGAGVYAAVKTGYVSTIDIAGTARRRAGLAWVALSTANVPVLHEKNITVKSTYDRIKSLLASKQSEYPNLYNAATHPGYIGTSETSSLTSPPATGTVVNYNSAFYSLGEKLTTGTSSGGAIGWLVNIGGYGPGTIGIKHSISSTTLSNGSPYYTFSYSYYRYTTASTITPVPLAASPLRFAETVTGSTSGGDAQALYHAELDKMAADLAYVPEFSDDTTGLPLAYPSYPLSPAALAAYNAQGVAADEREQALVAAQQAAASAVAAKNAAVSAAEANPTDTSLAQKAADATAIADSATAAAKKVAAENATTAAQDAVNEAAKESAVGISIPGVKSFSWARFADLKGSLAATFPFYLIPKIGDLMGQIAPETPTPPVFTLPVYGKTYQISLEMFDPIASALRGFIAVIASIACIIMMVKFYRGTS